MNNIQKSKQNNETAALADGGSVSSCSVWRVVARVMSMPRRLWCQRRLAKSSLYTRTLREPHAPTGCFSEPDRGDTATDCTEMRTIKPYKNLSSLAYNV